MKFNTKMRVSGKYIQIDKANQIAVIAVSATVAIFIFSVVASQALIKQMKYQTIVINKKSTAKKKIDENLKALGPLVTSFRAFDSSPESVIGTAEKNSKIVLDALPSKYDFPALATSLEGILAGSGVKFDSISGIDNEAAAEQQSVSPKPIELPVSFVGSGNVASVQKLLSDIYRSIRPIKIQSVELKGGEDSMKVSVTATTYYQPERKLEIKEVVIPSNGSAAKKTTTSTTTTGAAK